MSDEFEQGQPEETELTLDDLFQEEVDEEAVKKAASELLLPVGTYTTTPPFAPKLTVDKKTGRKFVSFWGEIVMGEVKGKLGFRLSSERRNKLDFETGVDTGKPDRAYQNYVQASKAFQDATGERARNIGDIVKYLRDYPIRLRVIQTGGGENMVVSISAVRPS